jgi:hypothetical protein
MRVGSGTVFMGGGLAALVAYGAQDVYLTGLSSHNKAYFNHNYGYDKYDNNVNVDEPNESAYESAYEFDNNVIVDVLNEEHLNVISMTTEYIIKEQNMKVLYKTIFSYIINKL